MRTGKSALRIGLGWLLVGLALIRMNGWLNLAGTLLLSALFGVIVCLGLLAIYHRQSKVVGVRRRWWAVAGVVVISLIAADLMREHLMSVRLLIAYGGLGNPAVVVLDNQVTAFVDVDPAMETPSGQPVIQEPFSHSARLGLPTTEWRLNDFRAESHGWGRIEVSLPGAKITYQKNRSIIVNGEPIGMDLSFWDRVLLGKVELIVVPASGRPVVVPRHSILHLDT